MCGGTSTMKGFNERVLKELEAKANPKILKGKHIPTLPLKSFQKYSAWIGGSMMS